MSVTHMIRSDTTTVHAWVGALQQARHELDRLSDYAIMDFQSGREPAGQDRSMRLASTVVTLDSLIERLETATAETIGEKF